MLISNGPNVKRPVDHRPILLIDSNYIHSSTVVIQLNDKDLNQSWKEMGGVRVERELNTLTCGTSILPII